MTQISPVAVLLALACAAGLAAGEVLTMDIRVPEFRVTQEDKYICTTVPLPEGRPYKLVGVEPLAENQTVHHILLFGAHSAQRQ